MVGVKSDLGNIRKLNEDYAGFYEEDNVKIYVVTDGMGGHNAGEIASEIAAESIITYIKENIKDDIFQKTLKEAIEFANKEVYSLAYKKEKYTGMGTTVVACLITNMGIQIGNVGDSSCFIVKDNRVYKITKDHSLVQELLDTGSISKEQAINHPQKNVITRAIGTGEEVEIDIYNLNKEDYDYILLCTDGVTNDIVLEEELVKLMDNNNIQEICNELVNKAKRNGGRDNITVMLLGKEV
ncbi:Stp1/IreP family PP2C-type Ser/Thr phosphatase [Clostridium sp.]|uniref:Stp1/IreP family PP2C-type Ser/Thr phosphatase n=1 Tax=Clostridium sp. TaxID=1506 RepID=UPI002619A538|nr:Stp1/IreP family PP2C-type Ser/Thr phosphatase [Clostridium sp.]